MWRKRLLVSGLAVLVLLGVGVYVYQNVVFEEHRRHVGFQGNAGSNGFLAMQRLTERLGGEFVLFFGLRRFDLLPKAGVTMFLRLGGEDSGSKQIEDLLRWVEQGNHLVLSFHGLQRSAEEYFGVKECDAEQSTTEPSKGQAIDSPSGGEDAESKPISLSLPDAEKSFLVALPRNACLVDVDGDADMIGLANNAPVMLRYKAGEGLVTVVWDFWTFDNHQLRRNEHASFYWYLASQLAGTPTVFFVRRLDDRTLLDLLFTYALGAMIAIAAFIVFWIWRIGVRFGPIEPDTIEARRSLMEHLRAVGRFKWKGGGSADLLAALRGLLQQRLMQIDSALPQLPPRERISAVAKLAGMKAETVSYGLQHLPRAAEDFKHTVQILASLFRALSPARLRTPAKQNKRKRWR